MGVPKFQETISADMEVWELVEFDKPHRGSCFNQCVSGMLVDFVGKLIIHFREWHRKSNIMNQMDKKRVISKTASRVKF